VCLLQLFILFKPFDRFKHHLAGRYTCGVRYRVVSELQYTREFTIVYFHVLSADRVNADTFIRCHHHTTETLLTTVLLNVRIKARITAGQHYLRPDLAVPTSHNNGSDNPVTISVTQTLEQSCCCLHQWLLFNLHPKYTRSKTQVLHCAQKWWCSITMAASKLRILQSKQ